MAKLMELELRLSQDGWRKGFGFFFTDTALRLNVELPEGIRRIWVVFYDRSAKNRFAVNIAARVFARVYLPGVKTCTGGKGWSIDFGKRLDGVFSPYAGRRIYGEVQYEEEG